MSLPRLSPGLYYDPVTVPVGTPLLQPVCLSDLLHRLGVLWEPADVQDAAVTEWLRTNAPRPWLAEDIRAHRPYLLDATAASDR